MNNNKNNNANSFEENYKGGPKTEEGKELVKHNALKHGILSKEVVLKTESQEEYETLNKSVIDELKPEGEVENILVDRISSNIWRIKRVLRVERNLMEWEDERHKDDYELSKENLIGYHNSKTQITREGAKKMIDNKAIERILRYEVTIERSLFKAIEALKSIKDQKTRK